MYSDVKIGDKFLVSNRNVSGIYPVTHITNKRFTVNGYAFNKETGSQVGGDTYSQMSIQKSTPEIEIQFKNKVLKNKLVREFKEFKFENLNLEELKQLKTFIFNLEESKKIINNNSITME